MSKLTPARKKALRSRPRRPRTGVSKVTSLSYLNIPESNSGGDIDLRAAADVVADGARELADWSRKIPASIGVRVDGNVATISANAPNAYPAEFRVRHPLFGDREHWYGPPGEPFLAPALDARIDDAMRTYANHVDRYAKKLGWK